MPSSSSGRLGWRPRRRNTTSVARSRVSGGVSSHIHWRYCLEQESPTHHDAQPVEDAELGPLGAGQQLQQSHLAEGGVVAEDVRGGEGEDPPGGGGGGVADTQQALAHTAAVLQHWDRLLSTKHKLVDTNNIQMELSN